MRGPDQRLEHLSRADAARRRAARAVPTPPSEPTPFPARRDRGAPVFFRRRELDAIMSVYGHMVAAGHWRDYALDALRDRAVFSIYRRSSQAPTYILQKIPALARKQGPYLVSDRNGRVLRRGRDLRRVLAVLRRPGLFLAR